MSGVHYASIKGRVWAGSGIEETSESDRFSSPLSGNGASYTPERLDVLNNVLEFVLS